MNRSDVAFMKLFLSLIVDQYEDDINLSLSMVALVNFAPRLRSG